MKLSAKLVRQVIFDNQLDVRVIVFPDGGFNLQGYITDVMAVHEILRGMGFPVLVDQEANTALILA